MELAYNSFTPVHIQTAADSPQEGAVLAKYVYFISTLNYFTLL